MTDVKVGAEPPGLDCMHVVRRLWDYLDGRVAEEERAQIVAHLASCSACSSHYRFEEGFLGAVGRLRRTDENFDILRSEIVAKLRAQGLENKE
jgi:anti-sigma factor (TIGR02949 family)